MEVVRDAVLPGIATVHVPGVVLGDARYERCHWERVKVVSREVPDLAERSVIRSVAFVRCRADFGWSASGVVLDDVVWERPRGEIWLHQCAFRHVRIVGPVSLFWTDQDADWAALEPIVAANRAFHEEVDWCLDMREAEVRDGGFRGVDPVKVAIDRDRQAFVSSEAARRGRHLVPPREALPGVIANELRIAGASDRDRIVFLSVFSKGRHAARERELIGTFHEAGLTLPTYEGPT